MDSKQNVDIFSMEVRSYRTAACLYTAKENMVASHEPVCFANNTATLYMFFFVRVCRLLCTLRMPTQERHVNQSYCVMSPAGAGPGVLRVS